MEEENCYRSSIYDFLPKRAEMEKRIAGYWRDGCVIRKLKDLKSVLGPLISGIIMNTFAQEVTIYLIFFLPVTQCWKGWKIMHNK